MYDNLSDFKAWANITSEDHDELITDALEAAAAEIDEFCGRTFTTVVLEGEDTTVASDRVYETGVDGRFLEVDDFVGAVSATVNGTTVEVTAVQNGHGRPYNTLRGAFGRFQVVTVNAKWGWPATPPQIVQASRLVTHKLWERRVSPYGTQGNVDIGFVRVTGTDRDVDRLLAPFARWSGAIA